MRDYTDVIAALRSPQPEDEFRDPIGLFREAADVIEALVKERDKAISDLDAGFAESDHLSAMYYQRMRDAEKNARMLAAEVERLRLAHAGQTRLALTALFMVDVDEDEGVQTFYRGWVRNHDAALIESLADHLDRHFQDIPAWTDAYREGVRTDEWMTGAVRMTTGAIGWLRERARQVREGEA